MKISDYLRVAIGFGVASALMPVNATEVNLVCRGVITSITDLQRTTREPKTLNIALNVNASKIIIQGGWGCSIAELGNFQNNCIEPDISIGESEIKHFKVLSGNGYRGNQWFTLNRNSGTLETFSTTQALPGSGAVWGIFSQSGIFECAKATRQF